MQRRTIFTLALLTLAALLGSSGSAQAEFPMGGLGHGFGRGFGINGNAWSQPYYTTTPYNVPYYALHPPVYLSYAIPRTFGYSPFAYPGWVRTPEVETTEPEMIENPHVEPAPAPAENTPASLETAQIKPLEVLNPYVQPKIADDAGQRLTSK